MELNLDNSTAKNQITAYQSGQVTINQQKFTKSIIVSPEQIMTDWKPQSFADISAESILPILALTPNIVILGTGDILQFPAQELLLPFLQQHIGIEVMTTGAACRTYNVLVSENRRVVAALLL